MAMKIKQAWGAGLLAMAIAVSGCATTGADLQAGGVASVVAVDRPNPFTEVKVIQQGDDLLVSGAVNRLVLGSATPNPGHVDVVVSDARGSILAKASHMVHYNVFTAKNQTRSLAPQAAFNFSFPLRAPQGTQVRLAFHEGRSLGLSQVFDCGDNKASGLGARGD